MAKKIFCAIMILFALAFALTSCSEAKGIENAAINDKGELILTYSDGTTENLGNVKGEDGKDGVNASLTDENPQGLAFYLKDDGTYAVGVGYAKYRSNIEIPASYNEKTVTSIGNRAFFACDSLTTIYCEAESHPSGWHIAWNLRSNNYDFYPVVWGYDASADNK